MSPPSSPVGVPESSSVSLHKGFFLNSFWVKTSFLMLTGFGQLAMRIDSRLTPAKQFQFLFQRLQEGGLRVLSKEDQDERKHQKTQCWSHFTCVLFFLFNRDKSSFHLQVLQTPLADDITMLLLWRLHALLNRSLLSSRGSFLLLLSRIQPSATIKGFQTILMLKAKRSEFWQGTKSLC